MTAIARIASIVGTLATLSSGAMAQLDQPASLELSRAYQAELLADAAMRTSELQGNSAGYNNGKFSITDGGANTLNIGGYIQARYLMNFRDDQPNNEDFTEGFQLRRTRMIFSGTVWDKQLY